MQKRLYRKNLLFIITIFFFFIGCGGFPVSAAPAEAAPKSPFIEEEIFEEYDIRLMAVGDNLMHMGVVRSGEQRDGSLDYSFLYKGISDYLNRADIKIINQETILAGNERGFSGYPYFNSPTQVGDAIADAGFNVVLHASNHAADQGTDGLINCANYWSEKHPEVLMTGIHANAEDLRDIPILTIGDIKFAILNYTYSPNMEVIPESLEGHLNLLCGYNEKTNQLDFTTLNKNVLNDIAHATILADVVIVCPHWGTEYVTTPSSYQKEFARQMAEAGADVIIGAHPHVPQPIEWVTADNGNRSLCYYSLGNFVSTQKDGISMLEGMAWVTFHVTEDGIEISEDKTGVFPMVCQYKSAPVRASGVYMLENYPEELAEKHGIRSYGGVNLKAEDLDKWSKEIFGSWVLSKKDI
ncbi:MAG: CapA family protein [Lachnospiraceae bacterium]|nr:CapA family protein [Lachnospiraceae bacterium]